MSQIKILPLCWPKRNEWIAEYRFHPIRKWRFDWAYLAAKIAMEINGGIFMRRGRHSGGVGQLRDFEKLNMAQSMGWKIFQFIPSQVNSGEASSFMTEVIKCV